MGFTYDLTFTKWNKLREKIYKRDKYSCQVCGKTKCILEIHHIVPYIVSKCNKSNNLISLCKDCHTKLHSFMSIFFIKNNKSHNKQILKNPIRKGIIYYNKIENKRYLILKTCRTKIHKIEKYVPPKWHLWTYGGYKNPIHNHF